MKKILALVFSQFFGFTQPGAADTAERTTRKRPLIAGGWTWI